MKTGMARQPKQPADPLLARSEALRAIGLAVEPTKDGKRWKVVKVGKVVPFMSLIGYATRAGAIDAAEAATFRLRTLRDTTDAAQDDG